MFRSLGLLALVVATACLSACASDIPYAELEARYGGEASHYMDLPGDLRVHYRDQGNPQAEITLVMVHGFAASLHAWEPWVERLGEDYRLVSLDLPGHGLTRAPAGYQSSPEAQVAVVDAVATRLGLPPFVLAGNSMGGGVAWRYALAHPQKVRGLVLVNAAGWPAAAVDGEANSRPLVFKLLETPVGRSLLRNLDPRPLAGRGLRQAYGDETLVTPELVDRYVALARAPGHRAILTDPRRRSGAEPVTGQSFAAIAAPTLVMVGALDQVIPAERGAGFAQGIPGARLITYADGGHVPMEQLPDRTAEDLRVFLDSLTPAS
ncbi:MAG: alpha/beta hydrolase [Phenylobacterium sp.]|uniref:alpha/beta fold hydrolase n=1 Tax=Phenylobacterium sp. TaxID=1871053 RepID=UPI002727A40B|nr:alpha/beta hydrolase [Phenylobacterium sp.]MDO8408521.1 alpha/beta hydrolase [Phenylobacterium sp.]